jgi:hypothetical protein
VPTNQSLSWQGFRDAIARSGLLLALLALVAALRSVDRNLALAVERGAPLDLDPVPAIAVFVAAAGTVGIFAVLHLPETADAQSRYARLWRLTRRAGLFAAVARLVTTAWTLVGPDRPSRFAGITGAAVLATTVLLIGLFTVESLSPGPGIAREEEGETTDAAKLVRLSLGVSWVFAGLALATPYAADQIGDLLLAWTDAVLAPAATFGIAGVLLLGLVLQEGAMTLVGAPDEAGRLQVRARSTTPGPVRAISAAVGVIAMAVFVIPGRFDIGTFLLLIPLGLIGLSEWAERQLRDRPTDCVATGATFMGVAVLPLFALAAGLVNATVDALFLYGPDAGYLLRAIPPAIALLVGAGALVVSTAYLTSGELKEEQLKPWILAPPVIAVAAAVWLAGSSQLAGLIVLAALIVYTTWGRKAGRLWALTLSLIAGAALLAATLAEPIETGRGVGAIGAIGVTVSALVTITLYLVRLFGLVKLPDRVRHHVPFDHVPVLSLLGVWLLIAVLTAPATAHDVQLSAAPPANPSGVDVDSAVSAWWAAQPESRGAAKPGEAVPLVLVAAEGGGLRASYWTGGVMDVLAKGPDPARRLESVPDEDPQCDRADATGSGRTFLLSGASGGSVGAYAYAQELAKRGCLAPGWYARWFARDVLGPTVSWGLFHDTFATLFHQRPGTGATCRFGDSWICQVLEDRARILEGSLDFDASARDLGLRAPTFAAPAPVPQLIFNTTADDVRERVELSTLQLEPRAGVVADGLDEHCAEGDLPLVTAAVLSARFPVVTSAGRIACAHRSLVDGGYLENTGVAAIAEVMPRLVAAVQKQNAANATDSKPPIRIVVVEISNGPRGPQTPLRGVGFPTDEPKPHFAPLGLLSLPSYPTEVGRDELGDAAADACGRGVDVALVTVRPRLAVGWKASVGWRLSHAARAELEQALSETGLATSPATAAALLDPAFSAGGRCPWLPG